MPRKRILYFSHTRQVSGAERVLLNMLAVLDRTRFEAAVACPTEGAGNLDQLVAEAETSVLAVPAVRARYTSNPFKLLGYLLSYVGVIWKVRGILRGADADLIHANSVRAGIVATVATLGSSINVLWHVQDDLPKHPISTLIRSLAQISGRTRFAAVSRQTARAFAGSFRFSDRINILQNGINLACFPRKTEADREGSFRSSLGLDPGGLLFVSVGMISPRKGLLELVEAFALAVDQLPLNTHLALVGAPIFNRDDLYFEALRGRIAALGLKDRIHLPGPRSDVAAVLRTADLLILNARVEPFGLVLVEAAASGTPILATKVGGVRDILGTEPPCGFLTLPPQFSSAKALAERLVTIGQDAPAREDMAERAYQSVCLRFSLEAFQLRLIEIYDAILTASPVSTTKSQSSEPR